MPDQDSRAVLGLPLDATRGEAQRAFRQLAKQTHPDAGGDPAAFRVVASAWADLVAVLPPDPEPTVDLRAGSPFGRRPGGSPYGDAGRPSASRVVWSEFRPPAGAVVRVRRNLAGDRDFAAVLKAEVARLAS